MRIWSFKNEKKKEGFSYSSSVRDKTAFAVLGLELLIVTVVVVLIFGVLNYFLIFPLSVMNPKLFGWLPTIAGSSIPKNITDNSKANVQITRTFKSMPVKLACPVIFTFCVNPQTITVDGHKALAYQLPPGSEIYEVSNILTTIEKKITSGTITGKAIYQSFIYDNSCYTVSYIFPKKVKLNQLNKPPRKGEVIGVIEKETNPSALRGSNLIITFQKRELDKSKLLESDEKRCSVENGVPSNFGEYQDVNPELFY
jgi:hypothetical protein